MALAEQMIAGLVANPLIFPNPPHPAHQIGNGIRWKLNQYNIRRQGLIAAGAAAAAATADKDQALENLVEAMKSDLLYAENTAHDDDVKLKLIGWSGKKREMPLVAPGQTRLLEVPKQGADWVFLDWKAPAEGGKPRAYKVQRRLRDGGGVGGGAVRDRWEDVATAILTEATLVDQPRGAQLEYRVVAVNKAGVGPPSNTVEIVL